MNPAAAWERLSTSVRQVDEVIRRDGPAATAGRALESTGRRLLAGARPFRLDVRREDLTAPPSAPPLGPPPDPGRPLALNWIVNPPDERSGGIQTLMRAVSLLEGRGHDCALYVLYQGARRDVGRHREVARRRFPHVRAAVHDLDAGLRPAHAVVASAWPTAWAARRAPGAGVRFYFVQDYEPLFYPAGSNAALAEETYRFGFHGLTAGRWLALELGRRHGMACDPFELGVDLDRYRPEPGPDRDGVVFYARPDTERRGYELGMMALELFARRCPGTTIHLMGQHIRWRRPTFAFVDHGHLDGEALARLYRRCHAGLVLSLTNLSLLPAELLASGCIPVMNDAEHTRAAFDNPHARFAPPRPDGLAEALASVVEHPLDQEARAKAAASVGCLSWDLVADQLEAGLRVGLARAHAGGDAIDA